MILPTDRADAETCGEYVGLRTLLRLPDDVGHRAAGRRSRRHDQVDSARRRDFSPARRRLAQNRS